MPRHLTSSFKARRKYFNKVKQSHFDKQFCKKNSRIAKGISWTT